jgi:(p)ppGpp synthase/HD superfamily hydrolase
MTHPLSPTFSDALVFAAEAHRSQTRKGPAGIPYIAHLMSVSALVLEAGGSEVQAIAALLHDAAEDQGGEATLAVIDDRFGPEVAAIVRACSDTVEEPKPPWRERKEAYIAHLDDASEDALLVSLADKVHNARSIVSDHRLEGGAVFDRFDPDSDQGWYYGELARAFRSRMGDHPLVIELEIAVAQLQQLTV